MVYVTSVFKKYRCHAKPIVPTSDLLRLIDPPPPNLATTGLIIFTSVALAMTKLKTTLFVFSILGEIRAAHKYRLEHWALVNNIADYCRGVNVASEKMSCYFGHHVHSTISARRHFSEVSRIDEQTGAGELLVLVHLVVNFQDKN